MNRNPKNYPAVGDILTRWGTTREVTKIESNARGTIAYVTYNRTERITISAWRQWAKDDSRVVHTAGEGADHADPL